LASKFRAKICEAHCVGTGRDLSVHDFGGDYGFYFKSNCGLFYFLASKFRAKICEAHCVGTGRDLSVHDFGGDYGFYFKSNWEINWCGNFDFYFQFGKFLIFLNLIIF
jgi:hypothetical protein